MLTFFFAKFYALILFKYSFFLFWAGNCLIFYVVFSPLIFAGLSPVLSIFRLWLKPGLKMFAMGLSIFQGFINLFFLILFMALGISFMIPSGFSWAQVLEIILISVFLIFFLYLLKNSGNMDGFWGSKGTLTFGLALGLGLLVGGFSLDFFCLEFAVCIVPLNSALGRFFNFYFLFPFVLVWGLTLPLMSYYMFKLENPLSVYYQNEVNLLALFSPWLLVSLLSPFFMVMSDSFLYLSGVYSVVLVVSLATLALSMWVVHISLNGLKPNLLLYILNGMFHVGVFPICFMILMMGLGFSSDVVSWWEILPSCCSICSFLLLNALWVAYSIKLTSLSLMLNFWKWYKVFGAMTFFTFYRGAILLLVADVGSLVLMFNLGIIDFSGCPLLVSGGDSSDESSSDGGPVSSAEVTGVIEPVSGMAGDQGAEGNSSGKPSSDEDTGMAEFMSFISGTAGNRGAEGDSSDKSSPGGSSRATDFMGFISGMAGAEGSPRGSVLGLNYNEAGALTDILLRSPPSDSSSPASTIHIQVGAEGDRLSRPSTESSGSAEESQRSLLLQGDQVFGRVTDGFMKKALGVSSLWFKFPFGEGYASMDEKKNFMSDFARSTARAMPYSIPPKMITEAEKEMVKSSVAAWDFFSAKISAGNSALDSSKGGFDPYGNPVASTSRELGIPEDRVIHVEIKVAGFHWGYLSYVVVGSHSERVSVNMQLDHPTPAGAENYLSILVDKVVEFRFGGASKSGERLLEIPGLGISCRQQSGDEVTLGTNRCVIPGEPKFYAAWLTYKKGFHHPVVSTGWFLVKSVRDLPGSGSK